MSGVLQIENLSCGYSSDKLIIQEISFDLKHGDFIGIVGPNGSGKTTLLRAMAGLLKKSDGSITLHKKELHTLNRREIAQKIAFVPQLMEPIEGLTVHDLVMLGRTPYFERFSFDDDHDHNVVEEVIEELDIEKMSHKLLTQLSGGEFQRVAVARALAQQPKIMLLDEPVSHMDIRYQVKILRTLRKLKRFRSMVCSFHDLSIASKFCDRMLLLKGGKMVAFGTPDKVLTQDNIWKAFRIKAEVKKNPKNKRARFVVLP